MEISVIYYVVLIFVKYNKNVYFGQFLVFLMKQSPQTDKHFTKIHLMNIWRIHFLFPELVLLTHLMHSKVICVDKTMEDREFLIQPL